MGGLPGELGRVGQCGRRTSLDVDLLDLDQALGDGRLSGRAGGDRLVGDEDARGVCCRAGRAVAEDQPCRGGAYYEDGQSEYDDEVGTLTHNSS